MKKHLFLMAAMACCIASCQLNKEEDIFECPGETRLTASIESQPQSKTSLSRKDAASSQVLWSQEDQIGVFLDGASTEKVFTLIDGAGTSHGVFSGEGTASQQYIAFYPHSMLPSLGSGTLRLTVPIEQSYEAGSFASGAYPMLAVSSSSALTFRNLCSVVQLSVTGHHPVTRIVFRSNDASVKVSGKATVSLSSPETPVLSMMSTACDSVALVIPDGVQLNESVPEHFFLVVPAQTYKGGFSVRLYTGSRYMDKSYTANFTMQRSTLHPADSFEFQPNGIDVSTTLEGEGSEEDPFLIQSVGDLVFMRDAVNSGESIKEVAASGAYYRLTSDIDLSPVCSASLKKSWTPIGSSAEYPFSGGFDGNHHTISGLYINGCTVDYQGLFGNVQGSVGVQKLTVQGEIKGSSKYVGMVAGNAEAPVSGCASSGSIETAGSYTGGIVGRYKGPSSQLIDCVNEAAISCSGSYCGGVVGESYRGAIRCSNKAIVTGKYGTGGVAGLSGDYVIDCFNYGDVTGSNDVGSIVGNQNAGLLYNCYNTGSVQASGQNIGGISGYSRQRSRLYNNYNAGLVSGGTNVGGITGYLSSNSAVNGSTTLINCINVAEVKASDESSCGAIVGYNEGAQNDPYTYDASYVAYCYWLYDASKGLGMATGIGRSEGESSGNQSLSDAQMKGREAASSALYGSYTRVVDALNAWAWDNSKASSNTYQGWKYDAQSGYPVLTGVPVQQPGGSQEAFTLSESSFEIAPNAAQIELEILSTLDYSMDLPSWITMLSVQDVPTKAYTKQYVFQVSANESTVARKGDMVFTNTAGTVLKASVTQQSPQMSLEVKQVTMPYTGASRGVTVNANVPWEVSFEADWCTVSPQKGSGTQVVSIKARENESYEARSAVVTISSTDGRFSYTVQVIQSGKVDEQYVDWTQYPFVHQSLFMRFTATWCGWCPRMNRSVHRAMELYPDQMQHVALHGGGSDLQFSAVNSLMSQYSISGFPTGVVDGRTQISNYVTETAAQMIIDAVKETVDTYGTASGVDIQSSYAGTTAHIDVGVYLKKAGDYKITVLLLEDGIVNAQSDYEQGDHDKYNHDDVARVAVTNVLGEAFSAEEVNTVKQFSYDATIPSGCKVANMRVLVYIQRAFGSDPVNQTSSSYGSYFVDNCATVALGDYLKLALEGAPSGGGGGDGGDGNEGITPGDDINM